MGKKTIKTEKVPTPKRRIKPDPGNPKTKRAMVTKPTPDKPKAHVPKRGNQPSKKTAKPKKKSPKKKELKEPQGNITMVIIRTTGQLGKPQKRKKLAELLANIGSE